MKKLKILKDFDDCSTEDVLSTQKSLVFCVVHID